MKKITQNVLLVLLCFLILFTSFHAVSGNGFVVQRKENKVFYDYDTDVNTSDEHYPFNKKSVTIENVGFDVLYGVSKQLVHYVGEVPYPNTRDESGEPFSGFEGLPYNPGSTKKDISNISYWGNTGLSKDDKLAPADLEEVNVDSIVSLRLHALSNSNARTVFDFGSNILYTVVKWLAKVSSKASNLVIMIKNINMQDIIDQLGLTELGKVINNIFIARTDAAGNKVISPVALFCLIAFLFSVVGFVIQFVKGGKKAKNLVSDILVLALVGLLIVGISLNNDAANLGSSVSDLTTKVAQEISAANINGIFSTRTSGTGSLSSMDTMYTEMSGINKALIDLQICLQFGVDSLKELSFYNLGDTKLDIANTTLNEYYYNDKTYKVTSDFSKIEYNLGYYYWWANSSAKDLASQTTSPETTTLQEAKLTQVITYLQKVYNKALEDGAPRRAEKIKLMVERFSRPSLDKGIMNFLIMIGIFLVLALCLWKYAFKVAMAKMSLIAGIVGLPVAGLLILTTRDGLVSKGKGILGIFAMSFIRITVFSIFFDIVIYITTSIISPNLLVQLIVFVLLLFMMKLNPAIDATIEKSLQSIERSIAPDAMNLKRSAKIWAKRKSANAKTYLDDKIEHGKVIGEDAQGNKIRKASKLAVAASTLNSMFSNSLNTDLASRKSIRKITSSTKSKASNVTANAYSDLRSTQVSRTQQQYAEADSTVKNIEKEIEQEFDEAMSQIRVQDVNEDGTIKNVYNTNQLTDEENKLYADAVQKDRDYKTILNDPEYRRLKLKSVQEELTEDEKKQLKNFDAQLHNLKTQADNSSMELDKQVQERVRSEAQQAHKEELQEALENRADAKKEEVYAKTMGVAKKQKGLKRIDYGRQVVEEKDFKEILTDEARAEALAEGKDPNDIDTSGLDATASKMYQEYIKQEKILNANASYKQKAKAAEKHAKEQSKFNKAEDPEEAKKAVVVKFDNLQKTVEEQEKQQDAKIKITTQQEQESEPTTQEAEVSQAEPKQQTGSTARQANQQKSTKATSEQDSKPKEKENNKPEEKEKPKTIQEEVKQEQEKRKADEEKRRKDNVIEQQELRYEEPKIEDYGYKDEKTNNKSSQQSNDDPVEKQQEPKPEKKSKKQKRKEERKPTGRTVVEEPIQKEKPETKGQITLDGVPIEDSSTVDLFNEDVSNYFSSLNDEDDDII